MTLYAYRDDIDSEEYSYFGCNLYFVWDSGEFMQGQRTFADYPDTARIFEYADALHNVAKGKYHDRTIKTVTNWLASGNPIVQFIRNCIDSFIGETKCVSLVKQAEIKHNRQAAFALYNILQMEKAFVSHPATKPPATTIDPPFDIYEEVQDHFAEQLIMYLGLEQYIKSGLSIQEDDPDDMVHGDFIFEISEKKVAKIRYSGHWTNGGWRNLNIFDDFDTRSLVKLLRGINASR
jgi:hypothetical protein